MKRCRDCQKVKPLDAFYLHEQTKDGRLNKCKECVKARVKSRYYRDHEKVCAYERERQKLPGRRRNKVVYSRRHRERNPEKAKARYDLNNAIRDGRVKRQPCELCGAAKAQAHHHDYSKPFDVAWRCFRCHREREHGQTCSG